MLRLRCFLGFWLLGIMLCATVSMAAEGNRLTTFKVAMRCKKLIAAINGAGHPDVSFHDADFNRRLKTRALDEDAAVHYGRIRKELAHEKPPVHLHSNLDHFGPLLAYWAKLVDPYNTEAALRHLHKKIQARTPDFDLNTLHNWMLGISNPNKSVQSEILAAFENDYQYLKSISKDESALYPEVLLAYRDLTKKTKAEDITETLEEMELLLGPKRVASVLQVPAEVYQTYSDRIKTLSKNPDNTTSKRRLQEFALNFRSEQLGPLFHYLTEGAGVKEFGDTYRRYVESQRVKKRKVGDINDEEFFDLLDKATPDNGASYDGDQLRRLLLQRAGFSPAEIGSSGHIGTLKPNEVHDILFAEHLGGSALDGDRVLKTLEARSPEFDSDLRKLNLFHLRKGKISIEFANWLKKEIAIAEANKTFGDQPLNNDRLSQLLIEGGIIKKMDPVTMANLRKAKGFYITADKIRAFEVLFKKSNALASFDRMRLQWPAGVDPTSNVEIAAWVVRMRQERGWSQSDLARAAEELFPSKGPGDRSALNSSSVYRLEKGTKEASPYFETVIKLNEVFLKNP